MRLSQTRFVAGPTRRSTGSLLFCYVLLAILQFELLIRGSESLKDKRRVVKSLKDKLHHEHMVSVAEVGLLDRHDAARLGLAAVGTDVKHLQSLTDRILDKLRSLHDAELGDFQREIIHGESAEDDSAEDDTQ